jgi:hypothetical protein
MSVSDDHKPEQPSTSTNDDHVKRIHGNCCVTVQEDADEVGISIESCH